jgi:hypothetical protein
MSTMWTGMDSYGSGVLAERSPHAAGGGVTIRFAPAPAREGPNCFGSRGDTLENLSSQRQLRIAATVSRMDLPQRCRSWVRSSCLPCAGSTTGTPVDTTIS